MPFDFFGKKPEVFEPIQSLESNCQFNLSISISISGASYTINTPVPVWISNYYQYLSARWPNNSGSMPYWYDPRMAHFDLLRPLHHGNYDYAHEFFCATIFPINALGYAIRSLFEVFMNLCMGHVGEALFSGMGVFGALTLALYSVLISCLGLIIRPLLSIPMVCEKIMAPQITSTSDHLTIPPISMKC